MLSKAKISFIRSLERKKERDRTGLFLAEGNKLVNDMLPFFRCECLVAKPSWMATQGDIAVQELITADENDIRRASLLKNPQDVLAVFEKPQHSLDPAALRDELSLLLDGIQDPGNLGTIVRLADWFGIRNVICSPDTADVYNPKTVQATMSSLARVHIHYRDLSQLAGELPDVPVYGTFLDGNNIYQEKLSRNGLLVMGNEGNGIRPEMEKVITNRLYIPTFPPDAASTESLNVAVATAVACAEFRRQHIAAL